MATRFKKLRTRKMKGRHALKTRKYKGGNRITNWFKGSSPSSGSLTLRNRAPSNTSTISGMSSLSGSSGASGKARRALQNYLYAPVNPEKYEMKLFEILNQIRNQIRTNNFKESSPAKEVYLKVANELRSFSNQIKAEQSLLLNKVQQGVLLNDFEKRLFKAYVFAVVMDISLRQAVAAQGGKPFSGINPNNDKLVGNASRVLGDDWYDPFEYISNELTQYANQFVPR